MDELFNIWATLMAGFITGIFAIWQIRKNAVTNARISWIENMRRELSNFLSQANLLNIKIQDLKDNHLEKARKDSVNFEISFTQEEMYELHSYIREANSSIYMIQFYLDKNICEHKLLEYKLQLYTDKTTKAIIDKEIEVLENLENDIIEIAKNIFSTSWKKVELNSISFWIYMKIKNIKN